MAVESVENSGLALLLFVCCRDVQVCHGAMLSKTSFRNKILAVVDIQRWVHTPSCAGFNCYGCECGPHNSRESGGENSPN